MGFEFKKKFQTIEIFQFCHHYPSKIDKISYKIGLIYSIYRIDISELKEFLSQIFIKYLVHLLNINTCKK